MNVDLGAIQHRSETTLDLDDVAYGHPVAVSELAALRNVAKIARRHYGSHADIADAIDRLDGVR